MPHRASGITESAQELAALAEVPILFRPNRQRVRTRRPSMPLELVPHQTHGGLHVVRPATLPGLAMTAVGRHVGEHVVELAHVWAHRVTVTLFTGAGVARFGRRQHACGMHFELAVQCQRLLEDAIKVAVHVYLGSHRLSASCGKTGQDCEWRARDREVEYAGHHQAWESNRHAGALAREFARRRG